MSLSPYRNAVEIGGALPNGPHQIRPRDLNVYRNRPPSDWMPALKILKKEWRWSAVFALAVVLAVALATLLMKPVYESEGRLQIDPPGSEVFSLDGSGAGLIDSEYINTEAQKLQTDDLALATIRELHLDTNPEIVGGATHPLDPTSSKQLTLREDAALRAFKAGLSIRRDPSSRLVGVTFAAHEPHLSADVVNTLMKLLVERNFQTRTQAIAESSVWLSRQLDDVRGKLDAATSALAAFGAKSGIADIDANSTTYSEKMVDLNKQFIAAESERIQFESFLTPASTPESLPQVRSNPVVQAMTQRLAELRTQLAQAKVIYGPNHAEVRKLQNQVAELEDSLAKQRAAIVSELWTNYRAAKARERLLGGEVRRATTDLTTLAQYTVLKKEADADRELYDRLYAKIKEAGIAAATKSSNIHIVSEARVLDHPTRPRRALNIGAGVFFGLIGGIALAFAKDRLQDRIHTADDIREWDGSPSVTVIPAMQTNDGASVTGRHSRTLVDMQPAMSVAKSGPNCFLLQRPKAPESEAILALTTMLFASTKGRSPNVVLVTSPLPREGKTTLANNLAIALAQHGKTCLVDADMRMPAVGTNFNLTSQTGLEQYLQGSATLEQVSVVSRDVKDLTIIPSATPAEFPTYLATGDPIKGLITRLRSSFKYVVIDTPPILVYADGLALSTLVDGVILVGRAGQTPRGAITRGVELLDSIHSARILTIVLNGGEDRYSANLYSY